MINTGENIIFRDELNTLLWLNLPLKNGCSLPTCLLVPSNSWDHFCMKFVKTFRDHWSQRCWTNRSYCCWRSLTQHLIWGNEAAFARQPESLGLSQGEWAFEVPFSVSSSPSTHTHWFFFILRLNLAAGSEREPLLAFEEILISFVPKSSCPFLTLNWKGAHYFCCAAGSFPASGTGKPQRGWSFPPHAGRANSITVPPLKNFEGPTRKSCYPILSLYFAVLQ